ncbi:MAG: hypothetical protein COB15_12600 [Flavobacteriales bacterium]|nr:MAG: hypothetical protein COB15_12600 [Flavobacteriales bacterium]
MKKYILLIIVIGLGVISCSNPNEKEIGEVNALISIVEETEKSLLSVDTSVVFDAKRQMDKDIAMLNQYIDTVNREEAFRLDDVLGNKKKIHNLMKNYPEFIKQINFSKNQLTNLKQDLENDLMNKKDFKTHYAMEQEQLMVLNNQINKVVGNIDLAIEKLKSDRPELLEIIERRKLRASDNE